MGTQARQARVKTVGALLLLMTIEQVQEEYKQLMTSPTLNEDERVAGLATMWSLETDEERWKLFKAVKQIVVNRCAKQKGWLSDRV